MPKIGVVGTVGIPACYGGFESLVQNLVDNKNADFDYTVFCSSVSYKVKLKSINNTKLVYIPIKANGISSVLYDVISLFVSLTKRFDVILILGVSGCFVLPFIKLFTKARIITNIDGLEWKREKWGRIARFFLKMSEYMAVKFSDVVVSDNQAIADYVKKEYNHTSSVIAYGGDHALSHGSLENSQAFENDEYYFTVCRIEPENNIHLILSAFSKTSKKIKFVGNWNASEYGVHLKNKYKNHLNIDMIDPIYDVNILYKMRSGCIGFIHGHSAGGTNPSLVEAMHFCKPIIAFDCEFNRYTTEDKAFYFRSEIDLLNLLVNEEPLNNQCGIFMKEIAEKKYTWKKITNQYEELYKLPFN